MFDMEWEEMREDAHTWVKNRNETVLKRWLADIGYRDPVGYYVNRSDNVVEIYTTRPGVLIGRAGVNVDVLRQMLSKEFGGEWKVKFVEIHGGFVSA